MSFVREALRDKPVFLYMMDDTSPFQDYSGYNRNAVQAGGTPTKHVSLVKGTTYAPIFGASITGTFAAPVFSSGKEDYSFSLEAWVRAISVDGTSAEQQVLGNLNLMDGLTINGNIASFVVKFATAPEARASYDLQQGRAVHMVGVKVKDKISLFINGELAVEKTLTDVQQASAYATSDSNLYSGAVSGTQKIAVAGIAGYAYALDQTAISRHFLIGTSVPNGDDVATAFRGERIPVSLANAQLFLDQWWTTDEQWSTAQLFNVSTVAGQLRPQFDGNTSIPGKWMTSFVLSSTEATSIYGVSFNWDGEGAVIEVSLDGTTWEVVQRGVNIGMIAPGFNPTNKELQIRVSFAGGILNDTSFLDNLNAVGIVSANTIPSSGRVATFTNGYPEREYRPLELHDNWGAELGTSGKIVISADTSEEAIPARTVEVWIKRTSTVTNPSISGTASTRYQNGVSGSATLVIGQWTLYHLVFSADVATTVTVNGPAQIGQVVIYDTALTAAQVAAIYAQYTGTAVLTVSDNSVVTVTESAVEPKIYAHDWSIQSAG